MLKFSVILIVMLCLIGLLLIKRFSSLLVECFSSRMVFGLSESISFMEMFCWLILMINGMDSCKMV